MIDFSHIVMIVTVYLTPYPRIQQCESFSNNAHLITQLEVTTISHAAGEEIDYEYETSSLPNNMRSLKLLTCDNCDLDSLPHGMISIQEIYCYGNNLSSLPNDIWKTLRLLVCGHNNLDSFFKKAPALSRLRTLYCEDNGITSLPQGMISLRELDCQGNNLEEIPEDMVKLELLNCRDNNISSLPESSVQSLYELYCENNNLGSLPDNMVHLEELTSDFAELEDEPRQYIDYIPNQARGYHANL